MVSSSAVSPTNDSDSAHAESSASLKHRLRRHFLACSAIIGAVGAAPHGLDVAAAPYVYFAPAPVLIPTQNTANSASLVSNGLWIRVSTGGGSKGGPGYALGGFKSGFNTLQLYQFYDFDFFNAAPSMTGTNQTMMFVNIGTQTYGNNTRNPFVGESRQDRDIVMRGPSMSIGPGLYSATAANDGKLQRFDDGTHVLNFGNGTAGVPKWGDTSAVGKLYAPIRMYGYATAAQTMLNKASARWGFLYFYRTSAGKLYWSGWILGDAGQPLHIVPEPGTMGLALLAAGAAAMGTWRKRYRRDEEGAEASADTPQDAVPA